jgi:hypothetical protein
MNQKINKYKEGQWFAIPLRKGGFCFGTIVRGDFKTKGGLGYFFGPKYLDVPTDRDTWGANYKDAILITLFGDLGIVNGCWPIIHSTRPFVKQEWPIPKFGTKISLVPRKGLIREYEQNNKGQLIMIREVASTEKDIFGLPEDIIMGGGSVEIKLTKILDPDP